MRLKKLEGDPGANVLRVQLWLDTCYANMSTYIDIDDVARQDQCHSDMGLTQGSKGKQFASLCPM